MSNFVRWTKHPDTHHWHHAYWMDDHFGHHNYGVRFNDDKIFDPRRFDMPTILDESDIPSDEIIDKTRDQYAEIFGRKQTAAESSGDVEPKPPTEIKLSQPELMIQLLRCSIEYNTSITALASVHAGLNDSKNIKQFMREYRRLDRDYRNKCNAIVDQLESKS